MGKVNEYTRSTIEETENFIDDLENQKNVLKELYVQCQSIKDGNLVYKPKVYLFIQELDKMIKDHEVYIDSYYMELEDPPSPI
jgi:hypothetical protein|tara:strand:- start:975 stop:1223 length:249 start_codon:yes stop_codon:yes gene_type:complete